MLDVKFFPLLPIWLPQMPELHTIRIFYLIGGVTLRFLKAIFTALGLKKLEIVGSPYTIVEAYDPNIAPITVPIQQFMYRNRPHSVTRIPPIGQRVAIIDEVDLQAYLTLESISLSRMVGRMVVQMHLNLETLMIHGETAQSDLMADLSWPCLLELTLYSVSPCTDVPMSSLLSHMQSLRTLHLDFAHTPRKPRFLICPPESYHNVPPSLTSLTLSWPGRNDQVFFHLPPTLRYLSLRDSPRIHVIDRQDVRSVPSLKGSEIVEMLKSSELTDLESLEVLYEGGLNEVAMLKFISASFPSLRRLELCRLRPNRWQRVSSSYTSDDIPIVCLCSIICFSGTLNYESLTGIDCQHSLDVSITAQPPR